jgi:hypothetical protein
MGALLCTNAVDEANETPMFVADIIFKISLIC